MNVLRDMAAFDRVWAGGEPDPNCPSCNGTGWATVFAGGVTVAGGRCKCRGGSVWAAPRNQSDATQEDKP